MSIQNTTDDVIVLKRKQRVGDVFTIEAVYALNHVKHAVNEMKGDENDAMFSGTAASDEDINEPANTESMTFQFGENTPENWRRKFQERLQEFKDVFIQHEFDIGEVHGEECDVILEPGPAVCDRPRPLPPDE